MSTLSNCGVLSRLLHYANANPPFTHRARFYDLKDKLLRKHGTFRGHEIQEIKKLCWGEISHYNSWGDPVYHNCNPACGRCGGTGIFDIRWIRLERWEWGRYVFHIPVDDTRVPPDPKSVSIHGRIEHPNYRRLSNEALLWLYLLCGEWGVLWKALRSWSCCGWYWWPMSNLQRLVMRFRMKLNWQRCSCGRPYLAWGSGWLICKRCRREPEEIPF